MEFNKQAMSSRNTTHISQPDSPVEVAEKSSSIGCDNLPHIICRFCGNCGIRELITTRILCVGICTQCGTGTIIGIEDESSENSLIDDYCRQYEIERLSEKPQQCWKIVKQKIPNLYSVKNILDVGCGAGDFLDYAKEAGLNTFGIELSKEMVQTAIQKGHKVLCSSIEEIAFPAPTKFDVCVMWDVLEHLQNPQRALRNVSFSLRPGGRLFILTPMMGSVYDRMGILLYRWSKTRLDHLLKMCWDRRHLSRFCPNGMSVVLQGLGFQNIRVDPILLLSLRSHLYAGGRILPNWTKTEKFNKTISLLGVWCAKLLHLHNKLLVEAIKRG